jgi:carbon-monoxide dehydrogenase large subunit
MMAGSAVLLASRKVKEKILRMAASYLHCEESDIQISGSLVYVGNGASEPMSLAELIQRVSSSPGRIVAGLDLEANHYFEAKEVAYPHGVHVARVRVDVETGVVAIEKVWSFCDVGQIVNPAMAEGQVMGGLAQGIGGALLEELAYDEQGQLLCTSFMDYLIPSSTEMPPVDVYIYGNDPSPHNPLGVKGAGEGGTAGIGAAIANAVSDALREIEIEILSLPLSPDRLLQVIYDSQRKDINLVSQPS